MLQSGELWTYLADLNEQAQDRMERMIDQMKAAEGITEMLKASDPMAWVQHMNNIRTRAEEIVRSGRKDYEIEVCHKKPRLSYYFSIKWLIPFYPALIAQTASGGEKCMDYVF